MVFIGGVRRSCGQRLGVWGPLVRPGGQVSSLHHLWAFDTLSTASTGYVDKTVFLNAPTHGRPAKVMWPVGYTLARLIPCFVPHHSLVSYYLWLCLILDLMKICMDFGPYGAFLSSDVLEMVDQQNSWNSFIIGTYLLYLEWNVGLLVVNICILWPPTTTSFLLSSFPLHYIYPFSSTTTPLGQRRGSLATWAGQPATSWLPYKGVAKGSLLLHPKSSQATSNFLNPSPSS
jgi:hypothetical protein